MRRWDFLGDRSGGRGHGRGLAMGSGGGGEQAGL